MANKVDEEMNRLREGAHGHPGTDVKAAAHDRLSRLQSEIEASRVAGEGVLACDLEPEDGLAISLKGQPVAVWKIEGPNLALYRAGAAAAECQASSVAEAAKLTARLVAATSQT
jgi:hypothetical protein